MHVLKKCENQGNYLNDFTQKSQTSIFIFNISKAFARYLLSNISKQLKPCNFTNKNLLSQFERGKFYIKTAFPDITEKP